MSGKAIFFGGPLDGALVEIDLAHGRAPELGDEVEPEGLHDPHGIYRCTYEGDPGNAIMRWFPEEPDP